ncbi:MAG TPA: hypothetical protein VMI31_01940 [Fimbriimonadaceae bacterium]|nr:hypothetical protein [Fimbriimonadaceae bacterium]
MYELLLLVGGIGFLAMALLGMTHGSGGGHHGHLGGHAPPLGHGHAPAIGHGHGGHIVRAGHGPRLAGSLKNKASGLMILLSPMDLFAMAFGAGAAGVLLKGVLGPGLLVWAAVAGALAFEFLFLKPLFAFALRFASKPSEGLEGTVALQGKAITKFDADGNGLIQLTLDGQIVQLLASLSRAEQELGEDIAKGDDVTVLEVDAKRNRCLVSKLPPHRNP